MVLLTDFGSRDLYAGVLKGVIRGICPLAVMTDLTHGVEPQNILQGAMILEDAFRYFPPGTVFLCVVDPGVGTSRKAIAVRTSHYFFVGPDNGLLSLAARTERRVQIRLIKNRRYLRAKGKISATFHGRDIFAPAAAHIAADPANFDKLGPRLKSLTPADVPRIRRDARGLSGVITAFDHYGNALTNIRIADIAPKLRKSGIVRVNHHSVGPLIRTYGHASSRLIALINSFDRLEIAFPNGSAQLRGGLSLHDPVSIRYEA